LRKNINLETSEKDNKEAIETLKHQIKALYNITKMQFIDHMQRNASKFNESSLSEEVSKLSNLHQKTIIKEDIIDFLPVPKVEETVSVDFDRNDSLEELKHEYEAQQNNINIDAKELTIHDTNQSQQMEMHHNNRRITVFGQAIGFEQFGSNPLIRIGSIQ